MGGYLGMEWILSNTGYLYLLEWIKYLILKYIYYIWIFGVRN